MTPHIDQALAHFRQRTRIPVQSAISSSTEFASSSEPEKAELHKIYSEIRIKNIEDQISQILQKVTFFFFNVIAQEVLSRHILLLQWKSLLEQTGAFLTV